MAEIVTETFADELRRNGHRVLTASDKGDAEAVINGTVLAFVIQGREVGVYQKEFAVNVKVEISVDSASATRLFTKTCRGEYTSSGFLPVRFSAAKNLVSRALLDMIEDCTTDPAFIDALRQIRAPRVPTPTT